MKEVKVRYKRTVLGYAWSLLNPVVYAVTYWFAFKAILNVRIEGYFAFLLAGLFPWQWLSNSLLLAPNAFVANAPLVKKIAFPRYLIVASSVATEGLHFLLTLPVFAIAVVALRPRRAGVVVAMGRARALRAAGGRHLRHRACRRVVQCLLSRHRAAAGAGADRTFLPDPGHL